MRPLMVRAVVLTALLTNPIILLFYLLTWLSLPSELAAVGYMQLADPSVLGGQRFETLARTLLGRSGVRGRRSNVQTQAIAFVLLATAFALQLPKVEGQNFYYLHPLVAWLFSAVTQFAGVLFYLAVALAFFAAPTPNSQVSLRSTRTSELELDRDPYREIGGFVAGIARVLEVQPAVLRVLFVFLNIMTFGVVGIIYLLVIWLLKKQGRVRTPEDIERTAADTEAPANQSFPTWIRILLGSLFLLLALTRLLTEVRLFFFNEPFFQGIVLCTVGLIGVAMTLTTRRHGSATNLWLIAGCAIMLFGVYELSTTLFHVQLALTGRFMIAYLGIGLAFLYFGLVAVEGVARRIAIGLATMLFLAALFILLSVAPARFLLALVEFYDFFYPILFAGFGLWLVIEQ
jgi:phage shock protein PspC (stress-responsive transcriptional regulator)